MVVINQVLGHTVQGIFTARIKSLTMKHTDDGRELTIALTVDGDDVAEIAANVSALGRRVKVIIEGEATQLTLWE